MKHWLLNIFSALSLVLCVATAGLWMRSCWVGEEIWQNVGARHVGCSLAMGTISLHWQRISGGEFSQPTESFIQRERWPLTDAPEALQTRYYDWKHFALVSEGAGFVLRKAMPSDGPLHEWRISCAWIWLLSLALPAYWLWRWEKRRIPQSSAAPKMCAVKRWVFTLLSGVLLGICLAAAALWIRSYWHNDQWGYSGAAGGYWGHVRNGSISVGRGQSARYPDLNLRSEWRLLGVSYLAAGPVEDPMWSLGVEFWTPTLVLGVPPTTWLWVMFWRWRRVARRRARGLCLTCGYDLRASGERCPECGTPIAADRQ